MRISSKLLAEIIEIFQNKFTADDELYLFGSRTDDNKKGGDIDLFLWTTNKRYDHWLNCKLDILGKLSMVLDEKADLIIGCSDLAMKDSFIAQINKQRQKIRLL